MAHQYRPLSTNNRGPRSRKGKAAVALAQLQHGLTSGDIVLPTEDAAEWSRFHENVLAQFEPQSDIEVGLASRVAEVLWRLRRIARAERQSVSVAQVHRSALWRGQEDSAANEYSDLGAPERQQRQGGAQLGFYADVLLAESAASRYRETLPVVLPDDHTLDLLIRYEAHLTRVLNHALHELEALQDRRNGNPTPLARIDIS